jgi:hypothetical protein
LLLIRIREGHNKGDFIDDNKAINPGYRYSLVEGRLNDGQQAEQEERDSKGTNG